jgi:hypothetical protein
MSKTVFKDGRKFVLDHFIYNVPLASLAPGASETISIPVQADSLFTLVKVSFFAALAGAAQTDDSRVIPLINVSITDSGSGQNLQNAPTPMNCLAGSEGLPMVWPIPREFAASSTIQVTFTNFSATSTYTTVTLALIGFKSFAQ